MNNKCIQIVNINDNINLSSASQIIEHFNVNDYNLYGFSTTSTSTTPEYVAGSSESFTSDINLYCIWTTSNVYYVTFYPNGGNGQSYRQPFANGVSRSLFANRFTRENYDFVGWSTTPSGSKRYDNGQSIELNNDLNLYAVWTPTSPTTDIILGTQNGDAIVTQNQDYIKVG